MSDLRTMTEQQLQDYEVPSVKTQEELDAIVTALVERVHDYGTCVYAMSIAATAAFEYVAHELGVTGFQASCADLDIIRRTRRLKAGFQLIDYENLLYPQYKRDFPNWDSLIKKNAERLAERARELLAEKEPHVSPSVLAHWQQLANAVPA